MKNPFGINGQTLSHTHTCVRVGVKIPARTASLQVSDFFLLLGNNIFPIG